MKPRYSLLYGSFIVLWNGIFCTSTPVQAVTTEGLKVTTEGPKVSTEGLKVSTEGLKVTTHVPKVNTEGLSVTSEPKVATEPKVSPESNVSTKSNVSSRPEVSTKPSVTSVPKGVSTTEAIKTEAAIKFEKAGIVPELIPRPPIHAMEILYTSKSVKFGNNLTRKDFENRPTNVQWPVEPNRFYTLIFTDPDCPRRSLPIEREWHHWLVVNIPGCNVLKGETLSEYIGGLPYYLQFPHRYVFLVYLQPEIHAMEFSEQRLENRPIESERFHFSTPNFTENYDLGDPIAGNYFIAGSPEPEEELPPILRGFTKKPKNKR